MAVRPRSGSGAVRSIIIIIIVMMENPNDNTFRNEKICQTPEINCSTVVEREEGTKTNCFKEVEGEEGTETNCFQEAEAEEGTKTNSFQEAEGEEGTKCNWSPVAMGENATGAQAFSPVGLKVLLVDDDEVCLAILEKMLTECNYIVTTCNSIAMALTLVQDRSTSFHLVLCDVHMLGMDGFKLLEALQEVPQLPVIMMSSDDETEVVMKGIRQGACDYLLKPISVQELRLIWQHVIRKRDMIEAAKDGDCDRDDSRKRKGKEEAKDDPVELVNGNEKKSRTSILYKQFVDAVTALGASDAVPKQILDLMNVKGISRGNVASHLQKY